MAENESNNRPGAGFEDDPGLWRIDPSPPENLRTDYLIPQVTTEVTVDEEGSAIDLRSVSYQRPVPEHFTSEPLSLPARMGFRIEQIALDLGDHFRAALERERETGSLFNFAPVALALGIGVYFSIPREPALLAVVFAAIVPVSYLMTTRARGVSYISAATVFLFFCGMLVAQVQVHRINTPVPAAQLTGIMSGLVLSVDQNQRGAPRYLVRPVAIEGLASAELPARIRLSASRKHEPFKPGDSIRGLARLSPVPGPAYPGGYDFAFARWMQGLGLTGFFMGAPGTVEAHFVPSFGEALFINLSTVRAAIAARIRAGLPGEAGDVAAALITGDRSGLSNDTQEALRRSGLAHILAISGLHMALATLTVIWLVRFVLVLIPGLTDRYPVRKWAITAGFMIATLYMFLSGAGIATRRAWLMITVMLLASLLDRRAITMRSVAIAALLILAVDPASLFNPGFQMSFAAVAALVAVYRDWTRFRLSRVDDDRSASVPGIAPRLFRWISGYLGGLSATSLIAGLATTLIAIWHFHRVAPLGLLSNLLAMPLVSLLVMPLSLASMLLMPYGLEGLALAPLGVSINWVIDVAHGVNAYETDFETGAKPAGFLLLAGAFLVLFTFLQSRLRYLALVPAAILPFLYGADQRLPDLIIAQDGRNLALRTTLPEGQEGREMADGLTLLYPRRGKFITDIWRKAYIPNRAFDTSLPANACSKDLCSVDLTAGKLIVVYKPELIGPACAEADFLIAPRLWWTRCRDHTPQLIINRTDLEATGAHAVFGLGAKLSIETAWPAPLEDLQSRPWLQRFDNVSRRFDRGGNNRNP